MKKVLFLLILILSASSVYSQGRLPADLGPNGGLKIECWNGVSFGVCASGGAGSDVNISGVGGNTVTTSVPVSCLSGCGSPPATPDNAVFTAGTTNVSITAGVFNDGLANVTSGNSAAPRITNKRALHVNFRDNSGVEIGTSANPIQVTGANGTFILGSGGNTIGSISNLFVLDATLTNRFPAGSNPANGETNTVNITRAGSYNYIFNGSTWDRWNGGVTLNTGGNVIGSISNTGFNVTGTLPAFAATPTFNIGTTNGLLLDATYTGRMPAGASPANGESNTNTSLSRIGGFNFIYNGTTWDRWTGAVTGSGNFNVTNSGTFAVQASQAGTWTVQPGNTANTTPWLTTISQGGNSAAVNGAGQLSITCANCSGSGASAVDESTFVQGTNSVAPQGNLFINTYTPLTTGQVGIQRSSSTGEAFEVIRDAAGNLRGANVTAANALVVDGSLVTQPVSGSVTVSGTIACSNCAGGTTTTSVATPLVAIATPTFEVDKLGQRIDPRSTRTLTASDVVTLANPVTTVAVSNFPTTSTSQVIIQQGALATTSPLKVQLTNSLGQVIDPRLTTPLIQDYCSGAKQFAPISVTANTRLGIGRNAFKVIICSISIFTTAAENISIVEGFGATCATTTLGVMGGATAANGYNFAANQGSNLGGSGNAVAGAANYGSDICLFKSGAGVVSGVMAYAYQP